LFSTFSLNKFSIDFFLNELINYDSMSNKIKDELIKYYSNKIGIKKPVKRKDSRISYEEILAKFHNPLTIGEKIFSPVGMKIEHIHFYHYHALPPIFEKKYPKIFKQKSMEIEKPNDWKGHFLCSAFVVEASTK